MLNRLYKSKKYEEVLGIIGIAYFLFLAILTFFLVHFLIGVLIDSFKPVQPTSAQTLTFNLSLLNQIKKMSE